MAKWKVTASQKLSGNDVARRGQFFERLRAGSQLGHGARFEALKDALKRKKAAVDEIER